VKYGSGKHGTVRYDLRDLHHFIEARKRRTLPPEPTVAHEQPAPEAVMRPPAEAQVNLVKPPRPVEPWTAPELPEPRRAPSRPRSPWDALIPADPPDEDDDIDPFAAAGRSAPRRPAGYFSGG
jgi:hypothetical protein